jgi:hypothetical protein
MPLRSIARICLVAALVLLPAGPRAQNVSRIDVHELKGWLSYLASDELQGRQVYTEGLGLAGAYIADHLKQWGVTPAGDNGTYFQQVKALGIREQSRSTVTVTVNGQTRTFKDGDGVAFARNQGGRQTLSGAAVAVGYGLTYAPLKIDDYAGRDVKGKVAVYFGRGGAGITASHNRLVNARARNAVELHGAIAAIGPTPPPPPNAPAPPTGPATQRVDYTTAQRLDRRVTPSITAGDAFFEFLLSGSGVSYADVKAKAEKREALPDIPLRNVQISIDVDASYDTVQTRFTRNVVGKVEGRDRSLRETYVLFGAHYDHVGYQQFSGTVALGPNGIASCTGATRPTPRPGDIINNGADDDGSGTVALMALAKAFAQGPRPKRTVVFVWHAGEEGGLVGSRYMADHPIVPLDRVAAQLNLDMIGRNRCDRASDANTVYVIGSDRISTELHNLNEDANAALARPLTLDYEFNDVSDLESLYTRSDHYSYAAKGVPIVFFTTGIHRDYHFVTDEIDKIEFPKLTRIAQLVYATGWRVANLDHLPARDNKGPRAGKDRAGKLPLEPVRPARSGS